MALPKETEKGDEIHFKPSAAPAYRNKLGWINTAKGADGFTAQMVYVIVDLGNGKEHPTRVMQTSITKRHSTPTSYDEALFQQHPDIEGLMDKLILKIASCSMPADDTNEFQHIQQAIADTFLAKLTHACKKQKDMGIKAKYVNVHFDK